jgi:hypothetical protein
VEPNVLGPDVWNAPVEGVGVCCLHDGSPLRHAVGDLHSTTACCWQPTFVLPVWMIHVGKQNPDCSAEPELLVAMEASGWTWVLCSPIGLYCMYHSWHEVQTVDTENVARSSKYLAWVAVVYIAMMVGANSALSYSIYVCGSQCERVTRRLPLEVGDVQHLPLTCCPPPLTRSVASCPNLWMVRSQAAPVRSQAAPACG